MASTERLRGGPCPLCDRLLQIDAGEDRLAVATLRTGSVVLERSQHHPGTTMFLSTLCVREPHHLPPRIRHRHFEELCLVTKAVEQAFGPAKLNVESLGNSVPHLHWWIFPRSGDDPTRAGPVWEDRAFVRAVRASETVVSPQKLGALKTRLRRALDTLRS